MQLEFEGQTHSIDANTLVNISSERDLAREMPSR